MAGNHIEQKHNQTQADVANAIINSSKAKEALEVFK